MPINDQQKLFVKVFVYEFTREFLFLSDVAAGRAQRKTTITDTLINLLRSGADASNVASAVGSALSYWHEWHSENRIAHIKSIQDEMDPQALKVLTEIVAREILRRYDYFITTRLTENQADGIIPFAKCAVHRILEYLARTRSAINVDTMLLGLIKGRTGSWVDGLCCNADLKGKGVYAKTTLFGESVFARSAFRTLDGNLWTRRSKKSKSLYSYGFSDFRSSQPNQPRNGYALVPLTLVKKYHYELHSPTGEDQLEVEKHPISTYHSTVDEIKAYLDQRISGHKRFYDYMCDRYPGTKTVVCSKDLTSLSLAGGDFSDCDLSNVCIFGDLSNTHFDNCYLIGATFKNIVGNQASFIDSHCHYTLWNDINIRNFNFSKTQFNFAVFTKAHWLDCQNPGSSWYEAEVKELQITNDSVNCEVKITKVETRLEKMEHFLSEYKDHIESIEEKIHEHAVTLEKHATEISRLRQQEQKLSALEQQLIRLKEEDCLTNALQALLQQLAKCQVEATLNNAFETFRPWLENAELDIDKILIPKEFPESLICHLRQFYKSWRQNPIVCCNEALFFEASLCYHLLVNIELRRAKSRLRDIGSTETYHALAHLYELAFIAPMEIDNPFSVVHELLNKLALGDASSPDVALLTQSQYSEAALLLARVLRLYVDLEVQKQIEAIPQDETKTKVENELHKLLKECAQNLGETLYNFTARQKLLLALSNRRIQSYDRTDLTKWQKNIESVLNRFHTSKKSDTRDKYELITYELKQIVESLKEFPQTSTVLALLQGLLSAISCDKDIFNFVYADLFKWRFVAGLICQAIEKQAQEAEQLLFELQTALSHAVKKNQHVLSYGLLDALSFIATHALLTNIRCQAFFGSLDDETLNGGITEFIHPKWGQHSQLSALHHIAIGTFKNIITGTDHPAFDVILERLTLFTDTKTGSNQVRLLDLFHEWVIDEKYQKIAKKTLSSYLDNCLKEINKVLKENGQESQLLAWCQRASLVKTSNLWKEWSKLPINQAVTRHFPLRLKQFYDNLAKHDTHPTSRAQYLALTLLMHLNTLNSEQNLQTLLQYTKLSSENLLKYVLNAILKQLFQHRCNLVLVKNTEKLKECAVLLNQLALALAVPNVYSEASEFLYRYLPGAVFFSDMLRKTVKTSFSQQSEIKKHQPDWHSEWEQSRLKLISSDASTDTRIFNATLEQCIDGQFIEVGKLSEAILNLLDDNGHLLPLYPASKNIVNCFSEAQLHLKANPEFPANEIAARILQGHLTQQWQSVKLVWFNIKQAGKPNDRYPVLLTQTIPGKTLNELVNTTEKIIDQHKRKKSPHFEEEKFKYSFSWQIIYALLVRLGDAKGSNYILRPDGILCPIDQEEIFRTTFLSLEEIKLLKEKFKEQKKEIHYPLGIKNILFCMTEMDDEVDHKVIDMFLKLSPEAVLQYSVVDMANYNNHLQSKEIESVEIKRANQTTQKQEKEYGKEALVSVLKIFLPAETISQFYDDFICLQHYLQYAKKNGKKVTHRDLLNELDPALGALYHKVFEAEKTPETRFKELSQGLYDLVEILVEPNASNDEFDVTQADYLTSESPSKPARSDYKSFRTAARYYEGQSKKQNKALQEIYTPDEITDACAELEIHSQAYQKAVQVQIAIMTGASQSFKGYFTSTEIESISPRIMSQIWQYMDFTTAEEKEPIIIAEMLTVLGKQTFKNVRHLHLVGAKTLSDDQFAQLIKHFPELRWVHLEKCGSLGQDSLIALALRCQNLMVLKLDSLPSLKEMASLFLEKRHYPLLIKLVICKCPQLEKIIILAPQLRHLELPDNIQLKIVQTNSKSLSSLGIARSTLITTEIFETITVDWSCLRKLDIRACNQLQNSQLSVWKKIQNQFSPLIEKNSTFTINPLPAYYDELMYMGRYRDGVVYSIGCAPLGSATSSIVKISENLYIVGISGGIKLLDISAVNERLLVKENVRHGGRQITKRSRNYNFFTSEWFYFYSCYSLCCINTYLIAGMVDNGEEESKLYIFDTHDVNEIKLIKTIHSAPAHCMHKTKEGHLIVGGLRPAIIKCYDTKTFKLLWSINDKATCLALIEENTNSWLLVGNEDSKFIRVYDLNDSRKKIYNIVAHKKHVRHITYLGNFYIASCGKTKIIIINIQTGVEYCRISEINRIYDLMLSREGYLIYAVESGGVKIWDIALRGIVKTMQYSAARISVTEDGFLLIRACNTVDFFNISRKFSEEENSQQCILTIDSSLHLLEKTSIIDVSRLNNNGELQVYCRDQEAIAKYSSQEVSDEDHTQTKQSSFAACSTGFFGNSSQKHLNQEGSQQTIPKQALYGLKYQEIPPDGHCLFHAIGLYLKQNYAELRDEVAGYLETHTEDFLEIIQASGISREAYIRRIRETPEWGDAIEIEIIQRVTDRPIIIIQPSSNPIIPENLADYQGDPIFIYYNGHTHYDAFILEEGANPREILSNIQAQQEQRQEVVYNPEMLINNHIKQSFV